MAWKKGESGNPGGRGTEKMWRDALRLAVNRYSGDVNAPFPAKAKVIEVLAQKLVLKALEGDVPAIKEIGDRLDGKAAQSVDVTHNPSDAFLQMLDAVSNGKLADRVAAEPGQPAPVRH